MIAYIEQFDLDCIDETPAYSFAVITSDGIRYTHPECIYTEDLANCYKIADECVRDNCEIETNDWLQIADYRECGIS